MPNAQVSVKLSRDAAADLREVRAVMSRDRDKVPSFSQIVRDLVALWRQAGNGQGAGARTGGTA